jgi:uncharacterized peroxidase-related enzyme
MAHIKLTNEELPGILGLLYYSPKTAKPLNDLAEALLSNDDNSLSKGEREIIAASVSYKNDCHFCHTIHASVAVAHFNGDATLIDEIKTGLPNTPVTPKLRALLNIAHHVQQGGKRVIEDDIKAAKEEGATDKEIHDTVLIAAAFCMYNRYVDGLATWAPQQNEAYLESGQNLAKYGYAATTPAI